MAIEMVKVVPGKGRTVRLMPGAKPLKEAGKTVPMTPLIQRWIANGDLEIVSTETAETQVSEAKPVAATTAPNKTETVGAKS